MPIETDGILTVGIQTPYVHGGGIPGGVFGNIEGPRPYFEQYGVRTFVIGGRQKPWEPNEAEEILGVARSNWWIPRLRTSPRTSRAHNPFKRIREAREITERRMPDIYDLHEPIASPQVAYALSKAAADSERPVVVVSHFHAIPHSIESRVIARAGILALRRLLVPVTKNADGVVAVSNSTAEWVKDAYKPEVSANVIYNSIDLRKVDTSAPPPKWWPSPEKKVILTFGRQSDKRKGFDNVLYAFAKVRQQEPDSHLVMLGEGKLTPKFENLARKLGIAENVSFIKRYLSDEELNQAIVNSDVAVFGSTGGEGFGRVIIDAYARGVPVAAGRIPGFDEALGDIRAAGKAIPLDIDSLALETVKHLRRDPLQKDAVAHEAKMYAKRYSAETIAKQQAEYYFDVYQGKIDSLKDRRVFATA